jgi:3-oxoacyl-[acyl-carrier protein] reductase
MKLEDKVALITGGTSGIGEAIAIRFASEGAKIAVVASAHIGKAEKVVDQISAAGGIAQAFVANVSKVSEIEAMVEAVAMAFGEIHILVNSAGIVGGTPAGATSEMDYDRIMDTNLKGTFFCANAVVPLMKAKGSGHIVNISGIGAFKGSSGSAAYSASKAGVISVTEALASELAPHGIHVNAIAPGPTATPGNGHLRTGPGSEDRLREQAKRTRSGRPYSSADDMARAALFLVCEDGIAMHGSVIVLDEGARLA